MRIKIEYTVDVSDDYRRAINLFYGREGLATREQVRDWILAYGTSEDENLMWALQNAEPERA